MMKAILPAIMFCAVSAQAQSECPSSLSERVELNFAKCETPASYALPKYKYSHQKGDGIEFKQSLSASGYIVAPNGASVNLKSAQPIKGDLMLSALDDREYTPVNTEIFPYNGFNLKEAKVARYHTSGVITTRVKGASLIPGLNTSVLHTDGLSCEFVKGKVLAQASCALERIDQGQYDCNCTYKILN